MSYIINLYKGKGDALERGSYRGLKLTEHCLKVVERVLEKVTRKVVEINEMQFGFVPGKGTNDAIFILRQLQEKHLEKGKILYLAFVDLEKAFDRVPREVLWWAMRRLHIPEWLVRTVKAMYSLATSRVRIDNSYSDSFEVQVGVHQGSVLSPLLFIIVLEALSQEFRTGCPWELLYADDLVLAADSLVGLQRKLSVWKAGMESKGLRVNMKKTKVMISGPNLGTLKDSGEHPCGVCRKGVGVNSIFCPGCAHWIHKKCSGIRGRLTPDPSFMCNRCLGIARPIDGRPFDSVTVNEQHLDVVDCFCYLGDTIAARGGCEATTVTRVRAAWGKFRELLPLLCSKSLSLHTQGKVYNTCVRGALLYASECWPLRQNDLARLLRNERAMLRWICAIKPTNNISTQDLCLRLNIEDLGAVLRRKCLRWFGHVQRSEEWIGRIGGMRVDGRRPRRRPRKTWREVLSEDLRESRLMPEDATDRKRWKQMTMRRQTRDAVDN